MTETLALRLFSVFSDTELFHQHWSCCCRRLRSACKAGLLMLHMSVKLTRVTRVVLPNTLKINDDTNSGGNMHNVVFFHAREIYPGFILLLAIHT